MTQQPLTAGQLGHLTALRQHWGEWYEIGFDGQWTARHRAGGRQLTAGGPFKLADKLRDDYARRASR